MSGPRLCAAIAGTIFITLTTCHATTWQVSSFQWISSGTVAADINDSGVVAGYYQTADPGNYGFIYDGNSIRLIKPGSSIGKCLSINNLGHVVGNYDVNGKTHAFLCVGNTTTEIAPNSLASEANDINDSGQITGAASLSGSYRAFLYSGGVLHDLGQMDGDGSRGYDVNSSGLVAGSIYHDVGWDRGFVGNEAGLSDIGYLNANGYVLARGLNDKGDIVGVARDSDGEHAFLFTGGQMIDLGRFSSGDTQAEDINNCGWIVGFSNKPGGPRGFLSDGTSFTDLTSLCQPSIGNNDIISSATAVSNSGWVTGYGYHNYVMTAWRMQVAVAEPGSLCSLLLGIAGPAAACGFRRAKRLS